MDTHFERELVEVIRKLRPVIQELPPTQATEQLDWAIGRLLLADLDLRLPPSQAMLAETVSKKAARLAVERAAQIQTADSRD